MQVSEVQNRYDARGIQDEVIGNALSGERIPMQRASDIPACRILFFQSSDRMKSLYQNFRHADQSCRQLRTYSIAREN